MGTTERSYACSWRIYLNTMTIEETREVIIPYFEERQGFLDYKHNEQLLINNNGYRIRPDDAFYYPDKVLLFEYENNARPVESISKYYWLLENTNWLKENIRIQFLITVNNANLNNIRSESIQILGEGLNQQYPNNFDFHFLNYAELTEENILAELNKMTSVN